MFSIHPALHSDDPTSKQIHTVSVLSARKVERERYQSLYETDFISPAHCSTATSYCVPRTPNLRYDTVYEVFKHHLCRGVRRDIRHLPDASHAREVPALPRHVYVKIYTRYQVPGAGINTSCALPSCVPVYCVCSSSSPAFHTR